VIVARLSNGAFLLGVDAKNIELLKAGKPIVKRLEEFGGKDIVYIMYGDDLDNIKAQIEAVFGKIPANKITDYRDKLQ
jgi:hypothetical protein